MMHGSYQEDATASGGGRRRNRMTPMDIAPGHDDDNDHQEYHAGATYADDELRGKSGVMRHDFDDDDEDEIGYSHGHLQQRRPCCPSRARWIVCGGIFLVALALAAGMSVQQQQQQEEETNNNNKSSNNNNGNGNYPWNPSPPTVPTTPPPVYVPPPPTQSPVASSWWTTSLPTSASPTVNATPDDQYNDIGNDDIDADNTTTTTEPPTASPQAAGATTRAFASISGVLEPPPTSAGGDDPGNNNSSSSTVDVEFGRLVAMNGPGNEFVAAMRSEPALVGDPLDHYGVFHIYSYDSTVSNYVWKQTIVDDLPDPPTNLPHTQALSLQAGRLAVTQGDHVSLYHSQDVTGTFEWTASVGNFGDDPSIPWVPIQMALSPQGRLLAVLLASENDSSGVGASGGMVEIYKDNQAHTTQGTVVEAWIKTGSIPLGQKPDSGSLAFDYEETALVCGYAGVTVNGGATESIVAVQSVAGTDFASTAGYGMPQSIANTMFTQAAVSGQGAGGSVQSFSANAKSLVLGSQNGHLNEVVLLRWNPIPLEWEAYGTNNVLQGVTYGVLASFGASVQLNHDGTRLFVGVPASTVSAGLVYVFEYDDLTSTWIVLPDAVESNQVGGGDAFATSIAIDQQEGTHLVVGMPLAGPSGAVSVYQLNE